ncbi:hypothetical protein F5Y17DRAFT_453625 [Xylariaceae sp. FL0594]|nr:hypothetical protein F5Y17DRAFT_453625 [Xylariaceae sp. FL0594]
MNVNWTYLTPALFRKLKAEDMPSLAVVCFRSMHLDVDCRKQWIGKVNRGCHADGGA